jgi:hypothetical protein
LRVVDPNVWPQGLNSLLISKIQVRIAENFFNLFEFWAFWFGLAHIFITIAKNLVIMFSVSLKIPIILLWAWKQIFLV